MTTQTTMRPVNDETPDDDHLQLDEGQLEELDPAWNLQERHAAIMRALAKVGVGVTGKNRFKRPALSIEDVDLLLERLMGRYGVVSDYQYASPSEGAPAVRAVELKTRDEDGAYERWEVWVESIIRDSRPADQREEERRLLFDVGSNPSAAISFALKRHKRELYHLGAVKEGNSDESGGRSGRRPNRAELERTPCPRCGNVGGLGWSSRKEQFYCAKDKGGCGADLPSLEPPAAATNGAAPAGASPDLSCGKCGVKGAVHRLANAPAGGKVAFCKRDEGGCGAYLTEEQIVSTAATS